MVGYHLKGIYHRQKRHLPTPSYVPLEDLSFLAIKFKGVYAPVTIMLPSYMMCSSNRTESYLYCLQ